MLKRTLKKLLQETTDKLNFTLLENRQLRERLEELERQNNPQEIEELLKKNHQLSDKIERIQKESEIKFQTYENEIIELEERNNQLTLELNKLKGEHFDTKRYAEDLKLKLENISCATQSDNEPKKSIPEPPPTPTVVTAEENDEESFKYASTIISEAVVHTASVTSRLSLSQDENANELKALAMGRCEMLKADVLQTVMSEMLTEAKTARMDKLLAESIDYLDGILGQISK